MRPDDQLLAIQIETLFRVSAGGRLLATNDPTPGPAPRVFLGRTTTGVVVRYRRDLPDDVIDALDRLVAVEPVATSLTGDPPMSWLAIRDTPRAHGEITAEWHGPAHRFPDILDTSGAGTDVAIIAVKPDDAALLNGAVAPPPTELGVIQPCIAAVAQGTAVAVCYAARRSALAAEAGVATLPAFRRRGLGSTVVSAWARAVQEMGLLPLYSTSWHNAASLGLAKRLQLIPYAEDVHLS